MKKVFCCFLMIVTCFLCSCSSKENALKEKFVNYYQLDNCAFTTSKNTEMVIVNLEKENSSGRAVVLTLSVGNSDGAKIKHQWLQLSIDERKADLKECGDMVIKYAQDNNWSNDYYLYIDICNIYDGCDIVYDYEFDDIWIPKCEDTFIEMYEKFNTFSKKELEETQEGIDFLLEKNLACIKHNLVEYYTNFSYTVYFSDGEFKSFGQEDSVRY